MIYVLIIIMGTFRGSVDMQEFSSKERCEAALQQVVKLDNWAVTGMCVPK